MSEKGKASPRQRQIMEQRWAKAREECPAGTCVPSSRFHVSGCPRKQVRVPRESLVVTNLNTGETSKAATVKDAMDANDKQAILLEPVIVLTQEEVDRLAKEDRMVLIPQEMHFPEEYWTPFERGQRAELAHPRILSVPKPEDVRALTPDEQAVRDTLLGRLEREMTPAPARPWWKFWGRRAR